jgi:hypothetical protein
MQSDELTSNRTQRHGDFPVSLIRKYRAIVESAAQKRRERPQS